jgi:hypothetical protein
MSESSLKTAFNDFGSLWRKSAFKSDTHLGDLPSALYIEAFEMIIRNAR